MAWGVEQFQWALEIFIGTRWSLDRNSGKFPGVWVGISFRWVGEGLFFLFFLVININSWHFGYRPLSNFKMWRSLFNSSWFSDDWRSLTRLKCIINLGSMLLERRCNFWFNEDQQVAIENSLEAAMSVGGVPTYGKKVFLWFLFSKKAEFCFFFLNFFWSNKHGKHQTWCDFSTYLYDVVQVFPVFFWESLKLGQLKPIIGPQSSTWPVCSAAAWPSLPQSSRNPCWIPGSLAKTKWCGKQTGWLEFFSSCFCGMCFFLFEFFQIFKIQIFPGIKDLKRMLCNSPFFGDVDVYQGHTDIANSPPYPSISSRSWQKPRLFHSPQRMGLVREQKSCLRISRDFL